jgi:putative peptide zinc metalloprotease protein
MSATLFSRDWYRVAELRPVLKRLVDVRPHRYRSERWFVLQDRSSGQIRRLRPEAWRLVGLMNGERTLQEIWQRGADVLGEKLPSHEELLQLVSSLYQANLIRVEAFGDVEEVLHRRDEQRVERWLGKLKSPLSIQIPLVDPERFLTATFRFVKPLFTRTALAVWCLMVAFLLVQAARHWDGLTGNLADRVLAAGNLLLLVVIYPCIKLLHELGHAYAVKRGGGEVHELGLMLLVFFPMPYVDASASAANPARAKRMLVGAIGMMVELAIAAVAMLVWVNAEPGLMRSAAFNVIFIAGVSALLFNGNPLLRFDAYYVLADYLEIPNLAQRANRYWGYLAKRYLFGLPHQTSPADDVAERGWLIGFGSLSFVYRLFISVTVVLFVSQAYPQVGVLLGIWTFAAVWLWPTGKMLAKPFTDAELRTRGRSPALVYGLGALGLVLLLGVLPLPLASRVEGVVIPREGAQVVAGERCEIDAVLAEPGTQVRAGDPIVRCADRELRVRLAVIDAEYRSLEAERRAAFADAVRLIVVDQELARLAEERELTAARLANLTVRAPSAGLLLLPRHRDLPGSFVGRGQVLGQVITPELVGVRAMVPETAIELVRNRTAEVTVRLASRLGQAWPARNLVIAPGATRTLVSPVLSDTAGGTVLLDADGESTIGRYFIADLDIGADTAVAQYINERVFVSFRHPAEPLAFRLARSVRRTFLDVFDV